MGGGSWSRDDYASATKGRDAFKVSNDVLRKPREKQKANEQLSPFGLYTRESRDSEDHPQSNAVAVSLDITGSMSRVVVQIRDELGNLMTMLLDEKIISDPQLLFCAVGDHGMGDPISFQISQFESDIRINDQLSKIVLVGGGGGNMCESYQNALYAMARHTALDCMEKRNKKGYFISIGDEKAYPQVSKKEIKEIFNVVVDKDITLETIAKEVQDKFNVLHIIPAGSSCFNVPEVRNHWIKLVGEERVVFPSARAVCATIAVFIGLTEGKFDLEGGAKMVEKISGKAIAKEVTQVLEKFANSLGLTGTSSSSTNTDDKRDTNTGKPKKDKPGRLY